MPSLPTDLPLDRLSPEEAAIVEVVTDFVERAVRPAARDLEHANEYPEALIGQMKGLGVFGLTVPPPYGESHVSTACFALVAEELARGWMSLSGAFGGHAVVCHVLAEFGTDAQKAQYLPRLATGEIRAAMALTEPSGGSDLQAMRTTARRAGDHYVVNGEKLWITNARRAGVIALLCKTDTSAEPPHRGMSLLLVEPGAGMEISRDLPKLGYRGIESCGLSFQDFAVPLDAVVGGREGRGFAQMMRGLEVGRIHVAARAVGVGRAALDDALRYARDREAFGVPIWRHQAIGGHLAEMATKITAARLLALHAADCFDRGRRSDLEAGMAKLFASEAAMEVTLAALRVHGGSGYSTDLDVERYFRDAPLMIVGEGTNEVQRNVIVQELMRRLPPG